MCGLQDSRVAVGFINHIKIFNTSTFVCEMELLGHSREMYVIIQLSEGRFCTESADKTI
jgi:hypothetical protein